MTRYTFTYEGIEYYRMEDLAEVLGHATTTLGMWINTKQWDKIGGYVKKEKTSKEKRKQIIKHKRGKFGYKFRHCTKCHEEFETELDIRGWAVNTRCPRCKAAEK